MQQAKPKILLYTDCNFFAGCEKPLENITNNKEITDKYSLVYAYRRSRVYTNDLEDKKLLASLRPLNLLTPDFFLTKIDKKNKNLYFLIKVLVRIPEKLQLFNLIYFIHHSILVIKEKPDIVHINNGGYPGADSCRVMAVVSGLLKVQKIVFTINNMAVPRNHFLDKLIDKYIHRHVDNFVTASNAASKQLISIRDIGSGKIQAIPNAVLFDNIQKNREVNFRKEFSISNNTFVIGSAGLLIKRKGYDVLVKAASLLPRNLDWQIHIFGEGDQRDFLEEMISEYHLEDKVFLSGFKKNIHSYISSLDIFVLPTTGTEDMPNAINEAMLMSKPIIASATSGIPEQIDDGFNGYLVEPGNYKQLASKLELLLLLENNGLKNMGINSYKKYMSSFSYNIAMNKYLTIYDS